MLDLGLPLSQKPLWVYKTFREIEFYAGIEGAARVLLQTSLLEFLDQERLMPKSVNIETHTEIDAMHTNEDMLVTKVLYYDPPDRERLGADQRWYCETYQEDIRDLNPDSAADTIDSHIIAFLIAKNLTNEDVNFEKYTTIDRSAGKQVHTAQIFYVA